MLRDNATVGISVASMSSIVAFVKCRPGGVQHRPGGAHALVSRLAVQSIKTAEPAAIGTGAVSRPQRFIVSNA